jgi:UPF0176 protein
MTVLHNRVSQKELRKRLSEETEPRTTISFYQYFFIEDPQQFRDDLYRKLSALGVFGRVYIAPEGINAQVSVPQSLTEALKQCLHGIAPLQGVRLNTAVDNDGRSFWVLKIKVRDKIVADGITDPSFDMRRKGKYLDATEFNQMSEREGVTLVDMRNHYEYEVGHFAHAMEVPSDTVRQQLPLCEAMLQDKKEQPVIMYCTGGIRCEKASAYLLHRGFQQVYHLEGGIIHYARQVKEKNLTNKFIGKNFVFDDRLGERISEDIIATCHQCGQPADSHTNCKNDGCHLLFIQCQACAQCYDGCCSRHCQEVYNMPEGEQKKIRKGKMNWAMVFNKSRQRPRPAPDER